jgi:hypothetical protein
VNVYAFLRGRVHRPLRCPASDGETVHICGFPTAVAEAWARSACLLFVCGQGRVSEIHSCFFCVAFLSCFVIVSGVCNSYSFSNLSLIIVFLSFPAFCPLCVCIKKPPHGSQPDSLSAVSHLWNLAQIFCLLCTPTYLTHRLGNYMYEWRISKYDRNGSNGRNRFSMCITR